MLRDDSKEDHISAKLESKYFCFSNNLLILIRGLMTFGTLMVMISLAHMGSDGCVGV